MPDLGLEPGSSSLTHACSLKVLSAMLQGFSMHTFAHSVILYALHPCGIMRSLERSLAESGVMRHYFMARQFTESGYFGSAFEDGNL